MKIIEKKLPIGKWRVTMQTSGELAGHEITSVALKGLRGRPWPVRRVSAEEFFERHPSDENGNPADTHIALRGMPSLWFNKGPMIYLWPSPSQDWTLEVTLMPKQTVMT